MQKFYCAYSHAELTRAKGMKYHPITGLRINSYVTYRRQVSCSGEWGHNVSVEYVPDSIFLPEISAGKDYKAGDAYPNHWKFCPFTGEHFENQVK